MAQIQLNLPVEELRSEIAEIVRQELREFSHTSTKKEKQQKNFTRIEAANLLRVSLPTLTEYIKNGKLTAHRIGSRVLIKEQDLEEALQKIGG